MRNLRAWFTFQVKFVRRSLDFARDDSVHGTLKQCDKLKFDFRKLFDGDFVDTEIPE